MYYYGIEEEYRDRKKIKVEILVGFPKLKSAFYNMSVRLYVCNINI